MIDCLLIGFNDTEFKEYVSMVEGMGKNSGAYRDLNLAFLALDGRPYRSMDLLNLFYTGTRKNPQQLFHNSDFLWPVITYLGTYLSRHDLSFDFVNLFHLEKETLKEKLLKHDILSIAITTTLYVSVHPILEIISFIREYNTTARIIVGGPYISNQVKTADQLTIQRLFRYIGADFYVISSEGEFALVNLLKAIKSGGDLYTIENIAYRREKNYVVTAKSTEINPLEENMVDYALFPQQAFGEFVTLRTAKSCPFACAFCGFPQRAGKYTYMDVDLVEKELNAIKDIGTISTLTFIDDTFNVPKGRFKEILRMMIRNRYGFKWNSYYRSDHGDEETIALMGEAGCEGVFLGVESGSDTMLEKMNKTARRRHYLKAIPLLKKAGILTHANLIIGFPGETYQTVQETRDFLEEARPDFYRAQLWYCDPTTPIWNQRETYGITGSGFHWSHHTMDVDTACDLVDEMFLAVEHAIWLPQYGFEEWSAFYLQRQGFHLEQIKEFVRCFNSCIKEKLLFPEKTEIGPHLLKALKNSCQLADSGGQEKTGAGRELSGERYIAAQKFWCQEFRDCPPGVAEQAQHSASPARVSLACKVRRATLQQLEQGCQADLSSILLAAYSLLLARVSRQQDTVIVATIGSSAGVEILPLRLSPSGEGSFHSLVRHVQHRATRAAEHGAYAFHLLTNPLRLAEYGCTAPVFTNGYLFCTSQERREEAALEDLLASYPGAGRDINLLLQVVRDGEAVHMHFSSLPGPLAQEIFVAMVPYFQALLEEASADPHLLLARIAPESRELAASLADESEVFNF
jgi:radical SAM PhpK family P-methyltransferase